MKLTTEIASRVKWQRILIWLKNKKAINENHMSLTKTTDSCANLGLVHNIWHLQLHLFNVFSPKTLALPTSSPKLTNFKSSNFGELNSVPQIWQVTFCGFLSSNETSLKTPAKSVGGVFTYSQGFPRNPKKFNMSIPTIAIFKARPTPWNQGYHHFGTLQPLVFGGVTTDNPIFFESSQWWPFGIMKCLVPSFVHCFRQVKTSGEKTASKYTFWGNGCVTTGLRS